MLCTWAASSHNHFWPLPSSLKVMGKWATYQKRGGSQTFGLLSAPGPSGGDWTIGAPTATTIPVTRVAAIPAPATQMIFRAINNATGLVIAESGTLTGLVTATTYRVQSSWWNAAGRISEYSPATLVITA